MEETLAELYRKLARHAASMIPAEWEVFHYLGEVEPGKQSWSSVFYFLDAKSGKFVQSNEIPRLYPVPKDRYMAQWVQLNNILLEIYQCFADNGQKPWEQMTLSVERSGKFNLQYHYDVMGPSDGGQRAREALWARKTFGLIPKDGAAAGRFLDEYERTEMKTAIVYYSNHHGNTKKVVDAIAQGREVTLIDASAQPDADLESYGLIGFASGIYFGKFHESVLEFARKHLPEHKPVFLLSTHGRKSNTKAISEILQAKSAIFLGEFSCRAFDTFGPLKLVGGINKGHPDAKDLENARRFFDGLRENYDGLPPVSRTIKRRG